MSTVERSEKTTVTVRFHVPSGPYGACWTEVYKAVRMAENELRDHDPHRYPKGRDVPDDAIVVRPGDDEIVVEYVKEPRS